MKYDYSNLVWSLPGVLFIGNALRGLVNGKLTTYGRGGRKSTYEGSDVVRPAIFQIIFGLFFVGFSFLLLLNSAHA